jgi:hypothetical protein
MQRNDVSFELHGVPLLVLSGFPRSDRVPAKYLNVIDVRKDFLEFKRGKPI